MTDLKTDDASSPESAVPAGGVEVIRSEERLDVSTRWFATETVRISRRVVTETRLVPVEVRTEVVEIEHRAPEGGTGDPGPSAAGPGSPRDLVVVLHEEVPVVSVRVRATERIRVAVRTLTSQVELAERVRSEHVEVVPAPPVVPTS